MNMTNIGGIAGMNGMSPEMINAFFKFTEMAPKVLAAIALVCLLAVLAHRIFIGILCKRFARKKGYTGYFWTGFFLGWLGFVYVIFLPDLKVQKYLEMAAMRIQSMENRIEQCEANKSEVA